MTGSESLASSRGLATRQVLTVTLLFAGYASYYFCRSDFSVALPMLVDQLHRTGLSTNIATVRLGAIASLGVLVYAAGKFLLGGLGDLWGGRRNFTAGLAGAVVFTFLFGLGGGLPIFTLAWIGNRLFQSMGWAGLVKVCSKWFSYTSYGTIVGVVSLSFLVGDAVARQSMGMLIQAGFGWRAIFYYAGCVAGIVLIANLLLLRESRTDLGYAEPEVNPLNVFEDKPRDRNGGLCAFLRPFVTNRAFGIVCFLSLGTTIIREAFNTWTPTYLHQLFGFSEARAAGMSAIFPAVGAVSVIVAGWAGDRLGVNGRSIVMFFGLVTTAVGLLALASIAGQGASPLIMIGVVAFGLLGPYSYLAGAMALDFGGSQGASTSSGIIDGVGYIGGIFAGDSVARLSVAFGWRGVFVVLAVVGAVSALAAGGLFLHQRSEIAKRKRLVGA